jgi:hypothetical protein
LSLKEFLGEACLVWPEHEIILAHKTPMQLTIRQHILFLDMLGVESIQETNKIVAAS